MAGTGNSMVIHQMTEDHLAATDDLRRRAGWNQTLDDWRWLLSLQPEGCFIAAQSGKVIGTVTTITYANALGWIGMMLVHPDYQRRGVATQLMRRALDYLHNRGIECIKLDATPAGRPVYEKLGFIAEGTLTRCEGPAAKDKMTTETRELAESDWQEIDKIDAMAFGLSRSQLLRSVAQRARSALVWPPRGAIQGWAVLRVGATADYLGPIVCTENARWLIGALLRNARTERVIWDVPDANAAAKAAAEQFGFAPLRSLTRMRLGPNAIVSDLQAQFAIADPAVG